MNIATIAITVWVLLLILWFVAWVDDHYYTKYHEAMKSERKRLRGR